MWHVNINSSSCHMPERQCRGSKTVTQRMAMGGMLKHYFRFSNVIIRVLRISVFLFLGFFWGDQGVEQEKGYLENTVREVKSQMIVFLFPLYSCFFMLLFP